MEDAFHLRYPKRRSARKAGPTALVLTNPAPRFADDGEAFFCARVAVREPARARNSSRHKYNRLKIVQYTSTYYRVKQFDYVCFQWGSLSEPPVILSQWPDAKQAGAALKEAHAEYERA